jgi:hypothetical protein
MPGDIQSAFKFIWLDHKQLLPTTGYFHDHTKQMDGLFRVFADACPESEPEDRDDGLSFAIVLQSCGYMESPEVESTIFSHEGLCQVFTPIVRAWVDALGLSAAAVGNYARAERAALRSDAQSHSLIKLPRAPQRVPRWSEEIHSKASLDLIALVRLLNHLSSMSLIIHLVGSIVLSYQPSVVTEAINALGGDTRPLMWMWLTKHAGQIWEEETEIRAAELFRNNDIPGSIPMLLLVTREVWAEPAIRERIRRAAMSTVEQNERPDRVMDARVAAHLLDAINDSESLTDAKAALAH